MVVRVTCPGCGVCDPNVEESALSDYSVCGACGTVFGVAAGGDSYKLSFEEELFARCLPFISFGISWAKARMARGWPA